MHFLTEICYSFKTFVYFLETLSKNCVKTKLKMRQIKRLDKTKRQDSENQTDLLKEVSDIKELLKTCNSILDFRCETGGCDKVYKRRGNLLKHQVDKHGVKPDPKILEIIKQDTSNSSLNTSSDFKEIKETKTSTQLPTTGVSRKRSEEEGEEGDEDEERIKKIKTEDGDETDEDEEAADSPKAKERMEKIGMALII